jgi:hypothetical protein
MLSTHYKNIAECLEAYPGNYMTQTQQIRDRFTESWTLIKEKSYSYYTDFLR